MPFSRSYSPKYQSQALHSPGKSYYTSPQLSAVAKFDLLFRGISHVKTQTRVCPSIRENILIDHFFSDTADDIGDLASFLLTSSQAIEEVKALGVKNEETGVKFEDLDVKIEDIECTTGPSDLSTGSIIPEYLVRRYQQRQGTPPNTEVYVPKLSPEPKGSFVAHHIQIHSRPPSYTAASVREVQTPRSPTAGWDLKSAARRTAAGLNAPFEPQPTQPSGNDGVLPREETDQGSGGSTVTAQFPIVSFIHLQATEVVELGPRSTSAETDWWVVAVGDKPGVYHGR